MDTTCEINDHSKGRGLVGQLIITKSYMIVTKNLPHFFVLRSLESIAPTEMYDIGFKVRFKTY